MGSRRRKGGKHGASLTMAYFAKWCRVLSNLSAGLLIVSTGVVVFLLLNEGMFQSTFMEVAHQDQWAPYFQSCRLSAVGFVADSCNEAELAVTGGGVWASLGAQLALDLHVNDTAVFVTTCVLGAKEDDYSCALMLLVGESAFPDCNPTGPQEILGLGAVETLTTEAFPDGAFLVSFLADQASYAPQTVVETNGNIVSVVTAAASKTIIAKDGVRVAATWEQENSVTTIDSFTTYYLMRLWLVAHFIELSPADRSRLPGYSVGKFSQMPLTGGWDHSHLVDNYMQLLLFQVVLCAATLALLSNDGVITLEGLSGLLKNKPVLTYDILASLERRKLLLVSLVGTFMFSPLYADAIRYSYFMNGYKFWDITLVMVAVKFALSWMAVLTCLQYIPVPAAWRHRPLCYSAPIFLYSTIVSVLVLEGVQGRGELEGDNFWADSDSGLYLIIYGKEWTAGAYSLDGKTPVVYLLAPDLMVCVALSWLVSIAARRMIVGYTLLDTSWASHNGFLSQIRPPSWVTSLDLDKRNAITMGNTLFCKPSMVVLLGYCAVLDTKASSSHGKHRATDVQPASSATDRTSGYATNQPGSNTTQSSTATGNNTSQLHPQAPTHATKHEARQYSIVSIYDLVPSLVTWLRRLGYHPRVFGVLSENQFVVCKSTTVLDHATSYAYSRGDCCG